MLSHHSAKLYSGSRGLGLALILAHRDFPQFHVVIVAARDQLIKLGIRLVTCDDNRCVIYHVEQVSSFPRVQNNVCLRTCDFLESREVAANHSHVVSIIDRDEFGDVLIARGTSVDQFGSGEQFQDAQRARGDQPARVRREGQALHGTLMFLKTSTSRDNMP